jgi:alpha-glucoside transport system permease protein
MTESSTVLPAPLAPPARTAVRGAGRTVRQRVMRIVLHVVVLAVCLLWFTPVLQLVAVGLRTTPDTAATGWWHIFLSPLLTMDNFAAAASTLDIGTSLPATLVITLPAVVLTVLLSAYGGYVLAHYRFRGNGAIYAVLVAMMAVPPQLAFTPLITLFSHLGIGGTAVAVWIFQVGYTVPFGVFLVRGFMYTIPGELTEAARVDGASDLRIFLQIVLPLVAPILASLGILQFMWSWNDLLTPLVFMGTTSDAAPITLQLAGLAQSTTSDQTNSLAAGAIITILPPLVILVALQRYFVAGITGGALK